MYIIQCGPNVIGLDKVYRRDIFLKQCQVNTPTAMPNATSASDVIFTKRVLELPIKVTYAINVC